MRGSCFATTHTSLEEVALGFMERNARGALKRYLCAKLSQVGVSQRAQRTLLGTWLTEIYLDEINAMSVGENRGDKCQSSTDAEEEAKQASILEFRQFLTDHSSDLDSATTYALLSSHGCIEELLFYARRIEDYDRVLTHHIQREDVASAIFILQEIPVERAEPLYYKSAPQMLRAAPRETVDAWIQAPFLAPCRLIPALVRYDQQRKSGENEAVRYLEYQVKENQNTDPAIHNYLLSLYATEVGMGGKSDGRRTRRTSWSSSTSSRRTTSTT